MIEALISHLFHCREIAHREHLRTDSYARHMALGDFYDAIAARADAIAEAWMGRSGEVLGDIPFVIAGGADIIAALEGERAWIGANRGDTKLAYSEVQNLIDGAVEEIDSTLYKLRRFA